MLSTGRRSPRSGRGCAGSSECPRGSIIDPKSSGPREISKRAALRARRVPTRRGVFEKLKSSDRKSTRLNSNHSSNSYSLFFFKDRGPTEISPLPPRAPLPTSKRIYKARRASRQARTHSQGCFRKTQKLHRIFPDSGNDRNLAGFRHNNLIGCRPGQSLGIDNRRNNFFYKTDLSDIIKIKIEIFHFVLRTA